MASVFTMIINGELPGRFVWDDPVAVGFLSINPLAPGHTLIVPRQEVDHWIDLDAITNAHLAEVARAVGRAQAEVFRPAKVGMMIAGLEVPHVHLHVVPINGVHDLDFANADPDPNPADLDEAAARIRRALRSLGYQPPAA